MFLSYESMVCSKKKKRPTDSSEENKYHEAWRPTKQTTRSCKSRDAA